MSIRTAFVLLLTLSAAALAQQGTSASQNTESNSWLAGMVELAAAEKAEAAAQEAPAKAPAKEGPPLPFHSIEGYGGGAITPFAYLINAGPEDQMFGKPAIAFTNVVMGKKSVQALTITETLFGRIELGYALNRFDSGSLNNDLRAATTVDIGDGEIWLHHFNARALLVKENTGDLPLPAITAGVHFKVNDGIKDIDRKLGGALNGIGYDKASGVDYTLTASKTLVGKATFNRPIIVTGGVRNSSAAQLGYLGFGDDRSWTFEGNFTYIPTDWLVFVYEFRQKSNPYDRISGLIGDEDNWHAVNASWIINNDTTLIVGWGAFGNVANTREDCVWWLQLKYEF